jgi:hypothetical protein
MTLKASFAAIESPDFAARVNMASTRSVFVSILTSDDAYLKLIRKIREDERGIAATIERIKILASAVIDPQYENPYDAALSAYMWAVHTIDPDFERVAAERTSKAPKLWWAFRISAMLLKTDQVLIAAPSKSTIDTLQLDVTTWSADLSGSLSKSSHTYLPSGRLVLFKGTSKIGIVRSETNTGWPSALLLQAVTQSQTTSRQWRSANG